MIDKLKEQAIALLKDEFDPQLEYELTLEATYEKHPFKEPCLAALFSFRPAPDEEDRLFVFVGDGLPMIYPDFGLTLDELWAVNVGNEYFIKMGVTEEPPGKFAKFLAYLKMVATVFQEQLYITLSGPPKIEKVYLINEQRHCVGRVTYNEKVYSWIVGDIPHFVYKKDLPPQVTWSLHMGRILLS